MTWMYCRIWLNKYDTKPQIIKKNTIANFLGAALLHFVTQKVVDGYQNNLI